MLYNKNELNPPYSSHLIPTKLPGRLPRHMLPHLIPVLQQSPKPLFHPLLTVRLPQLGPNRYIIYILGRMLFNPLDVADYQEDRV